MPLPEPEPGMVIHYGYLWARQSAEGGAAGKAGERGLAAGDKDRPCVILAVSGDETGTSVFVAPITHTAPDNPAEAIPMPAETRKRLGLDNRESWLMCSEVNEFTWPGLDLSRIPHREPRSCVYGSLPHKLFGQVQDLLEELVQQPAFKRVLREATPAALTP